jgi:hypothetical protein
VLALLLALAICWASPLSTVSAQEARDPIVDPPSGGAGSRFQIVGQSGWTPGETMRLYVSYTTSSDPLNVAPSDAPLTQEFTIEVLADGTWSFPVVIDEFFAADGGASPPDTPGYLIVRAIAPSHEAVNAYVYTVRSVLPAGAEAIVSAGYGPGALPVSPGALFALFAGGVGALFVVSGALRKTRVAG